MRSAALCSKWIVWIAESCKLETGSVAICSAPLSALAKIITGSSTFLTTTSIRRGSVQHHAAFRTVPLHAPCSTAAYLQPPPSPRTGDLRSPDLCHLASIITTVLLPLRQNTAADGCEAGIHIFSQSRTDIINSDFSAELFQLDLA